MAHTLRHRIGLHKSAALMLLACISLPAQALDDAQSRCAWASDAQRRARLLELYTSEGCSSCPPADRWLRQIATQPATRPVVPLSLHVKYWDYIGWKDPYAEALFTERQRWLAALNRSRSIYTPGVFLDGIEWADWSSANSQRRRLLDDADVPPAADIAIEVTPAENGGVKASIVASLRASVGQTGSRPGLFVALTESGLSSAVTAGENRGEQLRHDHVVRQWIGPVDPLGHGDAANAGSTTWRTAVHVDAARWTGRRFAISVFVQNLSSGEVLQAIRAPLADCRSEPPGG